MSLNVYRSADRFFLTRRAHIRFKQSMPLAYILYILYNMYMKTVTTTNARKNMKHIVDRVRHHGEVFGIGRRNAIEALIIQFPDTYNTELSDITNINAHSRSFDFLKDEPNIYSINDLKRKYV